MEQTVISFICSHAASVTLGSSVVGVVFGWLARHWAVLSRCWNAVVWLVRVIGPAPKHVPDLQSFLASASPKDLAALAEKIKPMLAAQESPATLAPAPAPAASVPEPATTEVLP